MTQPTTPITGDPRLDTAAEAQSRAAPLRDWLMDARLRGLRAPELFGEFCTALRAAGLPMARVTLHMPQLHPLLLARTLHWDSDENTAIEIDREHGVELTAGYLNSPLRVVYEDGKVIRRKLEDPDCPLDYPILDDLRCEGFSDYLIEPLPFSTQRMNAISFASRAPGGFSDLDIATLRRTLPVFGAVIEIRHVYRTSAQLMETYLGHRSGQRVLSGTIKRGDGEVTNAVLWSCDLRDFTQLSETRPLPEVIDSLNAYFEIVGDAIEEQEGEILKFIGDGVLAIFPIVDDAPEIACYQALGAARRTLDELEKRNAIWAAQNKPALRCGIALHRGDVMYGNIGTRSRLDFTVIGPAVNLVSRIEPLSRDLDPPLVLSLAFVECSGLEARSLGTHALKGIADAQEVFTLAV